MCVDSGWSQLRTRGATKLATNATCLSEPTSGPKATFPSAVYAAALAFSTAFAARALAASAFATATATAPRSLWLSRHLWRRKCGLLS